MIFSMLMIVSLCTHLIEELQITSDCFFEMYKILGLTANFMKISNPTQANQLLHILQAEDSLWRMLSVSLIWVANLLKN